MQVKPVKQYSEPEFPTRSILDERPELLRLVPKRWHRNPAVLTALAVTTAVFGRVGCDAADTKTSTIPGKLVKRSGLIGDVMIKMVIPSEEDARQVISEEAKKAGVILTADSLKVELPSFEAVIGKNEYSTGVQVKFDGLMDGTDKKHSISYEYVSEADLAQWNTEKNNKWFQDVKGTAGALESALKNAKPKGYYKVFWSSAMVPLEYYENYYVNAKGDYDKGATEAYRKSLEKQTLLKTREDLRAQVRDFIKWLKAEGVI